ncbi:hypothetical protein C8J56DRAFT_125437 [Mycena floridula]|nr:hypothetical protein C8J56DRAFT_125437 [Mycena floridula]
MPSVSRASPSPFAAIPFPAYLQIAHGLTCASGFWFLFPVTRRPFLCPDVTFASLPIMFGFAGPWFTFTPIQPMLALKILSETRSTNTPPYAAVRQRCAPVHTTKSRTWREARRIWLRCEGSARTHINATRL